MKPLLTRLRYWLIERLGGHVVHDCKEYLFSGFPKDLQHAAKTACEKVSADPSFKGYEGSNLGRNVLRDEACEWTKLLLKDLGATYTDRAVHLACELYHHLRKDSQN